MLLAMLERARAALDDDQPRAGLAFVDHTILRLEPAKAAQDAVLAEWTATPERQGSSIDVGGAAHS
jgi:hypothetical protein